MKRLLLTLMLAPASTGATAEWTQMSVNDVFTQYADFTTIHKTGDRLKIWELLDYRSEQKGINGARYFSEKAHKEYSCKEERVRLLAISGFSKHMGDGKVAYSVSDPAKWEPVQPASDSDFLLVKACSKK